MDMDARKFKQTKVERFGFTRIAYSPRQLIELEFNGWKVVPEAEQPAPPYDPNEHTVAEVNAHLDSVDPEEATRILEAEAAGQARKGILGDFSSAPAGDTGGATDTTVTPDLTEPVSPATPTE